MAISQDKWDKAKALFEQGLSLSQIEDKTEINKTSISKKAKSENWIKSKNQQLKHEIIEIEKEKSTLDTKINTAVEKLSSLSDFEITILDETIQNETGNKSLLFSTAKLSLIRKNQLLTKNTKQVIDFETIYDDNGKPISKKPIAIDVELTPSDLKVIDEGIDKNAVSLEIAPRHANSQVNISNTNAVQNNNTPLTLEDAKKQAELLGVPLSALI